MHDSMVIYRNRRILWRKKLPRENQGSNFSQRKIRHKDKMSVLKPSAHVPLTFILNQRKTYYKLKLYQCLQL